MKTILLVSVLAAAALLAGCISAPTSTTPEWGRELPPGARALLPLGPDEPIPDVSWQFHARSSILPALERSLSWMDRPSARSHFPIEGISYDRARASLMHFAEVLRTSASAADFGARVEQDFLFHRSAGWDGRGGGVLFTGYCSPILDGSLEPGGAYRYPLYGLPDDVVKGRDGAILGQRTGAGGTAPYPTRAQIEKGRLLDGQGLELAWVTSPLDAYIAHVNGSTLLRLPDGEMHGLGYAGKNGREYGSLREALVRDGELDEATANLTTIRAWAAAHPDRVEAYLRENDSFVFFTPLNGNPRGSLNVEVTGGRTLATDKSLFPRGALVYVETDLPADSGGGRVYRQFMFDQDTGGAIRTAGRADIYIGRGDEAERLAGTTMVAGQMYYLFLRDGVAATAELTEPPGGALAGY